MILSIWNSSSFTHNSEYCFAFMVHSFSVLLLKFSLVSCNIVSVPFTLDLRAKLCCYVKWKQFAERHFFISFFVLCPGPISTPTQLGVMLAGFLSVLIRTVAVQGGLSTIMADSQQGGRVDIWEWVCAIHIVLLWYDVLILFVRLKLKVVGWNCLLSLYP